MKPHFAFAVIAFGAALGLARTEGADFAGIYINKESPQRRIEFLPDGSYFEVPGTSSGTWEKKGGRIVCVDKQGEIAEFLLVGKNLLNEDKQPWIPLVKPPAIPWKDVSPLSIVVVDSQTHAPVTEFALTYTLSTPTGKYDPMIVRPIDVRSKTGTFLLLAPRSCQIELQIFGGAVLGGYGSLHKFVVSSENVLRRIEVPVDVGADVRGVVVDARTQQPIKDALVSPIIFSPPLFVPDRNRAVKTDAQGKFTIRGVAGMGINVWHPDYVEFNANGFERFAGGKLELHSGEAITGVVKDSSGKPLVDVEVSDGTGKSVRSGKDGTFTLRGARPWGENQTYNLSFAKEEYLDGHYSHKPPAPSPLSVVLRRQPLLTGRVLDPSGRPVKQFTVQGGPGREPDAWCCSSRTVSDEEGRFSLSIRTDYGSADDRKVWIGVKAPDFALWESELDPWQGTSTIIVRLGAGATVRGSIKSPGAPGQMTARLLPSRLVNKDRFFDVSQRQTLGRMETAVDSRGAFHFDHVRRGEYGLVVAGRAISPISTEIAVHEADVDVGALAVAGRGKVIGIVYDEDRKGRPWAFASGNVTFADSSGRRGNAFYEESDHLKPIEFRTDEHGRFRVENVPIGLVEVNIPYHVGDMGAAYTRLARVSEGRTTEARFFDTSATWELACQFVIGDISPARFQSGTGMGAKRKVENVTTRAPMFRVELKSLHDLLSYCAPEWRETDDRRQTVLHDVYPGKYHVVIGDWLMSIGFRGTLYEKDVEVGAGQSSLTVPLGAASITGVVQWSRQYRYMIHVLAIGKNHHAIHHARCDAKGNFCVRYLPPDEYTLLAHDFDAGWCRLRDASIDNDSLDIGSHKLVAGGTIAGSVPPPFAANSSVAVVAMDAQGLTIKDSEWNEPPGREFKFSGLWPGKWTIQLSKGGEVLSAKSVVLRGTESVRCDLTDK